MRTWGLIAVVVLCACRDPGVSTVTSPLRVDTQSVDFGVAALTQTLSKAINVENDGRTAVDISWSDLSATPFALTSPARFTPGANAVTLTFAPLEEREFTAELVLSVVSNPVARIALRGVGKRVECHPRDACHVSVLSTETGACIETSAANGTPCGSPAECLEAAQCVDGVCRGEPLRCDDGDHCTTDGCEPGVGCTHLPLVCPGAGECLAGSCDSTSGCRLTPVEDGLPCGTQRSCTKAEVCFAGLCVERDPPEGFICAEATPCQPAGHCVNDVCDQPPANALTASWVFDGSLPDGGPGDSWSDLMIANGDDIILSSYFSTSPRLHANKPNALSLPNAARRCIVWRQWLVCADVPGGGVTAYELSTGSEAWHYVDVKYDLPDLPAEHLDTFLARLFVLSPTRFGILFESRTIAADGSDTGCRRFSYVIVDENGHAWAARTIEDPIFEICSHPHSFGLAVDSDGVLYVHFGFSGTSNPASPAPPGAVCVGAHCSVLMALTTDATVKWKRADVPIGELAVGDGHLQLEHSSLVLSTQTGETVEDSAFKGAFGLGVVKQTDRVFVSDLGLTSQAYDTGGYWAVGPVPPRRLFSDVHAARWATSTGPTAISLALLQNDVPGGNSSLYVALEHGFSFQCELADVDHIAAFEIGSGGIAIMSRPQPLGATTCSTCDPRFAQTRNRFQWFPLPSISQGGSTWNGAYGGPTHSHQEQRP